MVYLLNISVRAAAASSLSEYAQILEQGCPQFVAVNEKRWSSTLYAKYGGSQCASLSLKQWLAAREELTTVNGELIGITRAESVKLDPHQFWIIREVERCFTEIGMSPYNLGALRVAVSVGAMADEFAWHSADKVDQHLPSPLMTLGQYDALLANRLSNHFGFTGISRTINAACSSSGVALLDGWQLLQNDAADMVVVAASNINLHPRKYASFYSAGMLTRAGACRPFDSRADGYVPCDAVAVALLVNECALAELGLTPVAEILGGAQNHNGKRSQSLTAPSVVAQEELLQAALENSRINPQQVGLIEAHATGTSLGDPIEVEALARVYGLAASIVGSHKGIFGHAEAAAGLLGLAKLVHVFRTRSIPGNRWVHEFNPLIDRVKRGLVFPVENSSWTSPERIIAGLSCFGFGGVNTHLLLAEPQTTVRYKQRLHSFLQQHLHTSLCASNSRSELEHSLDTHQHMADSPNGTTIGYQTALALNNRFRAVISAFASNCADENIVEVSLTEKALPVFALSAPQIACLKVVKRALASPFSVIFPDDFSIDEIRQAVHWLPAGSYLLDQAGHFTVNCAPDAETIVHQLQTTNWRLQPAGTSLLVTNQPTFARHYELHLQGLKDASRNIDSDLNEDELKSVAANLAIGEVCQKWELSMSTSERSGALAANLLKLRVVSHRILFDGIFRGDWQPLTSALDMLHIKFLDGTLHQVQTMSLLKGCVDKFLCPCSGQIPASVLHTLFANGTIIDLRQLPPLELVCLQMWKKGVRMHWDTLLANDELEYLQQQLT